MPEETANLSLSDAQRSVMSWLAGKWTAYAAGGVVTINGARRGNLATLRALKVKGLVHEEQPGAWVATEAGRALYDTPALKG